jgi:hypothetical protein
LVAGSTDIFSPQAGWALHFWVISFGHELASSVDPKTKQTCLPARQESQGTKK